MRELALEYAEKTRRRVLTVLPDVAADGGYGKCVMLIVHDHDAYYQDQELLQRRARCG